MYVNQKWPRWLAVVMALIGGGVTVLYFAAPDVPKLPAIPIFLLAAWAIYASHRASLAWLELSPDRKTITYFPSWFARKTTLEASTRVELLPNAELVVCKKIAFGAYDGVSIFLRRPGGAEFLILGCDDAFPRKRLIEIASRVAKAAGIPLRLAERRLTSEGESEAEWSPDKERRSKWLLAPAFSFFLLPFVGVLVRTMTSSGPAIFAFAILLWLLGLAAMVIVARMLPQSDERPALWAYLTVWSFRFGLMYLIAVLVTGEILSHHLFSLH